MYWVETVTTPIFYTIIGHVIPKEQLLPVALSKGPSGVKFDFTFHNRDQPNLVSRPALIFFSMTHSLPISVGRVGSYSTQHVHYHSRRCGVLFPFL